MRKKEKHSRLFFSHYDYRESM